MNRFLTAAVTIAALTFAVSANAASFKGTFWDAPANTLATIDDAITYATDNAPNATFTSTEIKYGNPAGWGIGTLGNFLQADSGSIVGDSNVNFQESVLKLTGKSFLTFGDIITVKSDDGFRLFLDGGLFSDFAGLRGPNNSTSKTFEGQTGLYDVTLWYFEGNVSQAQLISNLTPSAVPLPAGGLLLLTALVGGGLAARRRRA